MLLKKPEQIIGTLAPSGRGAVLECDQRRQTGRRRTVHLGQSATKRAVFPDRSGDKRQRKKKKSGGDRGAEAGCMGHSSEAAAVWTGGGSSALTELRLSLSSPHS